MTTAWKKLTKQRDDAKRELGIKERKARCAKCKKPLGPTRYQLFGDPRDFCSPECRDDDGPTGAAA